MYQGYNNMSYSPTQMRLNQMEQMYPQYQQPMQYNQYSIGQQPQQNMLGNAGNVLKGRPVTSLDEARAAQIDFDGSVFFFPDIANGKIYTKQINLDGTATLKEYKTDNVSKPIDDQQQKNDSDYLDMIEDLQNQIDDINKKLGGSKHEYDANVRHDGQRKKSATNDNEFS